MDGGALAGWGNLAGRTECQELKKKKKESSLYPIDASRRGYSEQAWTFSYLLTEPNLSLSVTKHHDWRLRKTLPRQLKIDRKIVGKSIAEVCINILC